MEQAVSPRLRESPASALSEWVSVTGSGKRPAPPFELVPLLLGVAFLLVAAVILLRCPMPPLQDFCEWIYQSYLAKVLLLHGPGALPGLSFKHWPVPNELSQSILTLLMLAAPPIAAAHIFLLGYLAFGALALRRAAALCSSRYTDRLWLVLLPLVLVNTSFWTGELNYQIGLLLFLSYVVTPFRKRQQPWVVLAASLTIFVAHILPLLYLFLFVFTEAVLDMRRDLGSGPLRLAALVPAGVLGLWWRVADPRPDHATSFAPALHGLAQGAAYRVYVFSKLGIYHNFLFGGHGDFDRDRPLYLAGVAANGLVLLLLASLLVLILGRAVRSRTVRAVPVVTLACTVFGLIDPATLLRNANVGERLLLPAVALALLLGGISLGRGRLYLAVGTMALLLLLPSAVRPPQYNPGAGEAANSLVNDPKARTHIFYWTRPYLFAGHLGYAEHLAEHQPVSGPASLSFGEGMLRSASFNAPAGPGSRERR